MRVYFEVYGCWMNKGEAELMKYLLRKRGHEIVEAPDEADAIVVVTCAVRLDTERKIVLRISQLYDEYVRKRGKKMVIAGCLTRIRPATLKEIAPKATLIDPYTLDRIVDAVEGPEGAVYLSEEEVREIKELYEPQPGCLRYVVPAQTGCTGNCAFCVGVVARRRVISVDKDVIVKYVEKAVKAGAREVFIAGQDLAAYGIDKGYTLVDLLKELRKIEGRFYVRVGMMEPWMAMKIADDLAELMLEEPRIYKFVHLPVQSGDDRVLKLMNRRYTVAEYIELVGKFRGRMPDITLATDVIVGFPGEDEEAFQNTLKLIRTVKPDKVHLARYTIRPFTKGALMRQVPEPEKKRRSEIAAKVCDEVALERNRMFVGKKVEALVAEINPMRKSVIARAYNYKPIVLENASPNDLGKFAIVKIKDATPIYLRGEVVEYI